MSENNHVVVFTPGTDSHEVELMNYELAKVIGEHLHNTYPGYLWRVNADIPNGIVNVLNFDISMEMGCTLMVADLVDPHRAEKLVKKAGGEMLERAKLFRGQMREREVLEAKRDLRGNIAGLN